VGVTMGAFWGGGWGWGCGWSNNNISNNNFNRNSNVGGNRPSNQPVRGGGNRATLAGEPRRRCQLEAQSATSRWRSLSGPSYRRPVICLLFLTVLLAEYLT